MTTKVSIKVISDNITKHGRQMGVELMTTDNDLLNDFLDLPITINKTYPNNTSLQAIKKDMKDEIESIVNAGLASISSQSLIGKELTFDV